MFLKPCPLEKSSSLRIEAINLDAGSSLTNEVMLSRILAYSKSGNGKAKVATLKVNSLVALEVLCEKAPRPS